MIGGASVTAVIPARCGSKGIPRKNLQSLGGRTLLEWAIGVARDCAAIDRVMVSTDCEEFAEHARAAGAEVPLLRPPTLAGDSAKTVDAVLHLLEETDDRAELVVLLQPTAPFRGRDDVDGALRALHERDDAEAVISVCALEEPHPFKLKRIEQGWLHPFLEGHGDSEQPRQALAEAWRLNGAIYAIRRSALVHSRTFLPSRSLPFVMPAERSVNIDHPLDLAFARCLLDQGLV